MTILIYSLKYQSKSSKKFFNPIGNVQAYVTDDYTVVEVSFEIDKGTIDKPLI